MKFAINFANFGYLGDVSCLADLACDAEAAGWDGVFLWDHVNWTDMGFPCRSVDCARHHRGAHRANPHWHRRNAYCPSPPRETGAGDSDPPTRSLTAASCSAPVVASFPASSTTWAIRAICALRAEMLDEGLELLQALWSGAPVDFNGTHYQAKAQTFCCRRGRTRRSPSGSPEPATAASPDRLAALDAILAIDVGHPRVIVVPHRVGSRSVLSRHGLRLLLVGQGADLFAVTTAQ